MSDSLNDILISSSQPQFDQRLNDLYKRQLDASLFEINSDEWKTVLQILRDVANRGDEALVELTNTHDKVNLKPSELAILPEELEIAHKEIDKDLLKSLRKAISNARKYQKEIFVGKNKHKGLRYIPFKRVGICVPGASAPLPSTVIMCAVPAQVAEVEEVVIVSPPRHKGTIHPVILAVCYELGIKEVYRVGGAQAVAALASGTKTITKVDKVVGPGNKWVTTAKKMVANRYVSIDSIAGPSEVLIIANDKANPTWIAADMLSQAEHAPGSAVVFTDSRKLANEVLAELKNQVNQLGRAEETIKCLVDFGGIVIFDDMNDVIKHADELAAEHLEIQCGAESRKVADRIHNAGAIFIGDYSPVAVGDYWAGPSHTLPTARSARFSSALTSNDFIKSTSIIEYDKKKLAESADDIIRLAEAEGLDAHAKSIRIRQQD